MKGQIRRRIESIRHYIIKAYWKLATYKPPLLILAALAAAISILLLGGTVYDLLEKPFIIGALEGRWIAFYPYTVHEQFLYESLMVMTLYGLGVAGFLLVYLSTKYAYKPRQAFMLLLMGAIFILMAYLLIENQILRKLTVT